MNCDEERNALRNAARIRYAAQVRRIKKLITSERIRVKALSCREEGKRKG
jgi:hypothetical protein